MPGHATHESKEPRFNEQETNFKSNNFSSAFPAEFEAFLASLGRESSFYIYLLLLMFYNERLLFENCGEKLMQGYNLLLVFKKFKVHEKLQCFGVKRALLLSGQVN